jgi:phosphotransferase family enzyme
MPADPGDDAAAAAARLLLGRPPEAIERVRGLGRNSGVWHVRADGASYALKQYPQHQTGERDRAAIEYGALRFMTGHGVAAVPRPVAYDSRLGVTLIEWIEGERVADPAAADIAAAAELIAAIHALRGKRDARALPQAAEACLSGTEIVLQIERRLARLGQLQPEEPALAEFLAGTLRPLLCDIAAWAAAGYSRAGLSFDRPIEIAATTLCPADFGFHNVLRRQSGELVFVDFDYFGWDDPAKLVADFLLHPGMSLGDALKRQFAAAAAAIYRDDASFRPRLRLLHPLFALRWCTIVLNEFLPERWAYRVNAGNGADWSAVKRAQLDRARQRAQSLATSYRRFPYGQ